MNQPEFLPLMNAIVAILLSGNIFFIKKLVDKIEDALEGINSLNIKVAVLDTQVNPGNGPKDTCHK